jgi:hypothetical protein
MIEKHLDLATRNIKKYLTDAAKNRLKTHTLPLQASFW